MTRKNSAQSVPHTRHSLNTNGLFYSFRSLVFRSVFSFFDVPLLPPLRPSARRLHKDLTDSYNKALSLSLLGSSSDFSRDVRRAFSRFFRHASEDFQLTPAVLAAPLTCLLPVSPTDAILADFSARFPKVGEELYRLDRDLYSLRCEALCSA